MVMGKKSVILAVLCAPLMLAAGPADPGALVAVDQAYSIQSTTGGGFYQVSYTFSFPNRTTVYIEGLGTVPATGRYTYMTRAPDIVIRTAENGPVLSTIDAAALEASNIAAFRTQSKTAHDFIALGRAQLSSGSEAEAIASYTRAIDDTRTPTQAAQARLSLADALNETHDYMGEREAIKSAAAAFPTVRNLVESAVPSKRRWCNTSGVGAYVPGFTFDVQLPTESDFNLPERGVPWSDAVYFGPEVQRLLADCFYTYTPPGNRAGINEVMTTFDQLTGVATGVSEEVAVRIRGVYRDTTPPTLRIAIAVREERNRTQLATPDSLGTAAALRFVAGLFREVRNDATPTGG